VGAGKSFKIEWISDPARIHALEQPWRELEARVAHRTPISGFDYTQAWYRNYSGTGPERCGRPLVGAAWSGRELLGLAPWTTWRGTLGKIPVRRVDFVGFNAEGGEFLIPEEHPELAGRFVESACVHERFDLMSLNGCCPGSGTLHSLQEAAGSSGMTVEQQPYRYAEVQLGEGFEAYRQSMSRNFRRSLRRNEKKVRLAGAPHVERFTAGADIEELPRLLERMFAIGDTSWKVRATGPMARHHRDFYRETITRYAGQNKIDFSILTIGGQDAAFLVGVVEGDTCFDLTISFADEFAAVSPGFYLMVRLLKLMSESGIARVISYGDHPYKERWASGFVPRLRLWLFRGPRAAAAKFIRFKLGPHLPGRHRKD